MFHIVYPVLLSECYHLCMHILRDVQTNQRLIAGDVMQRLDELLSRFSPAPVPPPPPLPPALPWPPSPPELPYSPPRSPPRPPPSGLPLLEVYALSVLGFLAFTVALRPRIMM